jgi:hypothetical protein
MRRVSRDDLARHRPVEQHADRGEVLLDGRLLEVLAETPDMGATCIGSMSAFVDILAPIAPGEESSAGMKVGRAGVRVVDGDGEEFQKPAHRVFAGRAPTVGALSAASAFKHAFAIRSRKRRRSGDPSGRAFARPLQS